METSVKVKPENRIVKQLDCVIDFATLGEYRVVTDRPRKSPPRSKFWAEDLDWVQRPRTREVECRLPRARTTALG